MVRNSLVAITLFLIAGSAFALEFPKLCPSANNLPKICEELSKISSNKTLVFNDGFEMPACAMMTSNPEEKELVGVKKEIMYKIGAELHAIGAMNLTSASEVFRNPALGRERYPKLAKYFDKLDEIRKSTENAQIVFPIQSVKIMSTARWAKKEILNVMFRQNLPAKVKKSATDQLNQIQLEDENMPTEIVPCRPEISSFYEAKVGGVNVTLSRAQYPPLSRLVSLGHELGHNFDSCTLGERGPHPILPKLLKCLQKEVGNFVSPIKNVACDVHSREAFCDHIGVHLVEQSLQEFPPIAVRDERAIASPYKIVMPPGYDIIFGRLVSTCNDGLDANDKDSAYPTSKHRMFDIFMRNPSIAKALNCPYDPRGSYCDIEKGKTSASKTTPAK